jgi:hypothetical protein
MIMVTNLTEVSMEPMEYFEQQAAKTTAFHLESIETLNKRAHTLVTLLLGGAGAVGTVAIGMAERNGPWWWLVALFGAMAWLFAVATYIVRKGLMTEVIYPPGNEPANLLPGEGDLDSLRREELKQVGHRINGYVKRNGAIAAALDRAYQFTAATPIICGVLVASVAVLRAAAAG